MNLLKNLLYIKKVTDAKLGAAAIGELFHGMFLAAPTGMLLFIIWELFKEHPDNRKIWLQVLILVLIFVGQLWVAKKVMVKTNAAIFTMTSRLRIMFGDQLHKLSLGFYKKRDPGDLASVVLQDVNLIEFLLSNQFQTVVGAVFGTFFLSVFLILLDWKLAMLMIAVIPIAFFCIEMTNKIIRKISRKHLASRNETGSRFVEYVLGVQHLKAFNSAGDRFPTLKKAFQELRTNSIRLEVVSGVPGLTSVAVFEIFFLLMMFAGVIMLHHPSGETIAIPTFVAFLVVGNRLYAPLQPMVISYALLTYMNLSLQRIRQVLDAPVQDAGEDLRPEKYDIIFDNVDFTYIDRKILKEVSITIPEKGLTALVGPSGSGENDYRQSYCQVLGCATGEDNHWRS